jgi:hypothetical protein
MDLTDIPQINLEQGLNNEKEYNKIVDELQSKMPGMLDDFKKYYVFYNKNPNYNEYQTIFEGIKGNLNSMMTELFVVSNNAQVNTETINQYLFKLNEAIELEKRKNKRLKKMANRIDEKYNSSDIMINDYKTSYNIYYFRNFTIFLGIVMGIILLNTLFKKKIQSVVTK